MQNRILLLAARRWLLAMVSVLVLAPFVGAQAPKRILLLASGPDGHPAGTHEYVRGLAILQKSLADVPGVKTELVKVTGAWSEGPELLAKTDAAVLFLSEGGKWLQDSPGRLAVFQQFAKRKGGLAVIHWGMGAKDAKYIDGFVNLFGACHGGPDRKYAVVQGVLTPATKSHPILAGVDAFKIRDEFYYSLKTSKLAGAEPITPLLKIDIDGGPQTVAWAWRRPDGGRSFGFSGLHFHENWTSPEIRRLVVQGALWTVGVDNPK